MVGIHERSGREKISTAKVWYEDVCMYVYISSNSSSSGGGSSSSSLCRVGIVVVLVLVLYEGYIIASIVHIEQHLV